MSRRCSCFKIEGYNILCFFEYTYAPEWQPNDLTIIFHSPYRSIDIVAKHIYQIVHAWNSKRPVSNGWKWLDHHFPCKYLESCNRNKHFGMDVSCKSIFWTSYVLHRTIGWNPNWWRYCSNKFPFHVGVMFRFQPLLWTCLPKMNEWPQGTI